MNSGRMAELPDEPIKKAFISGKTDSEILDYFRKRGRKFLTKEKIGEIDRRYFPLGRFHIKNVKEDVESRDYVYVNLNTGELYYIKNHSIKSGSNLIKKIVELPEDARKNLFNLMSEGSMDIERFGSKDIASILERKGLAKVYSIKKPSLLEIILDEILSTVKTFATGKAVVSNILVVEKRRIRKRMRKLRINKFYNLENFIDTRIPESGFDPDRIVYKTNDVLDVIMRILKRDVIYEDIIYLPYYKCKYVTSKGARYLNLISPKLRG